jgi:hypothetical protein
MEFVYKQLECEALMEDQYVSCRRAAGCLTDNREYEYPDTVQTTVTRSIIEPTVLYLAISRRR